MFSLQEYQHVHLLWFKKRSFTLVWKPNPPLRSVRCAHLHARADAASESTMGARCFCAASALLTRAVWNGRKPGSTKALALKAPLFTWSVKSDSCYNVLRLAARVLWSSADHALAQVRPRQIFTRTLSKNGRKCPVLSLLVKYINKCVPLSNFVFFISCKCTVLRFKFNKEIQNGKWKFRNLWPPKCSLLMLFLFFLWICAND